MGLRGSLEELPLQHLVEMTSLGGKSGRLVIYKEDGEAAGELAFRGGRLVGAACGQLSPEKAFYALLGVRAGTYDFDTEADVSEELCNLSTESLLIEGMRRIDEMLELRRALPAPAIVRLIGGTADDQIEGRVLGYLGPGARNVGDIVDGVLVGADADEYDALKALSRLRQRGVVRIDVRPQDAGSGLDPKGLPQPELER